VHLASWVASAGLLLACAPAGSSKKAFSSDVKAETELLAADRAFAHETVERGIDGWVEGFADDGVMLPSNVPLARGKAEIRDVMGALLSDPTNRLEWDPDRASVSASGDLGYTIGHTSISKVGPSGAAVVVARLKYVTVWKRQADGKWKAAVTSGTADP
jgi:ketosteroid isomerase-like protein